MAMNQAAIRIRRAVVSAAVLCSLILLPAAGAGASGSAPSAAAAAVPGQSAPSRVLPSIANPAVNRLAGPNRYATAVAVSREAFPAGQRPKVVFLVSGMNYPDALSAAPAAAALNGITLLTNPGGLPADVEAELRRLRPERIVILGQSDAVSSAVQTRAEAIAPVERLAGSDRFETSRMVARYAFGATGSSKAWIATGFDYPDALAAGAAAGANRAPLLLVRGNASAIEEPSAQLLTELGVTSVVIAGSAPTVSSGIEQSLPALVPGSSVHRAGGNNRYETALLLAEHGFPNLAPGRAFLATGLNYPDALVGSAYAGRLGRPLLLTTELCIHESIRSTLLGSRYTALTLLGSPGTLRGLVGTLEQCRSIAPGSSIWAVINKQRPFNPARYVPSGLTTPQVAYPYGQRLRSEAAQATARMFAAARAEGAGHMQVRSGYRSYDTQHTIYWNRRNQRGQAYADRWIARPGFSEHQSGLTLDVAAVGTSGCAEHTCLGNTPQGRWLAANSWRFGFILRYGSGQEAITGYAPEPWHFRYVGVPLATDYYRDGWRTLEEYVGLPPAPRYAGQSRSMAPSSTPEEAAPLEEDLLDDQLLEVEPGEITG
ncbi:MAG: cell wall-binding repeat-containing protein [Actinomycetia bacterium]|nr:cell wall-binding repeat-containing protein [Actinomycetes bacterium]